MDRFDCIEVTTWTHVVTSIKSNLSMWSPLYSQTCPCGHLYTVKPVHVVTSIQSNLSMWSPLCSQTCPCGHFIVFGLTRTRTYDIKHLRYLYTMLVYENKDTQSNLY
jgi:hypothetical protein